MHEGVEVRGGAFPVARVAGKARQVFFHGFMGKKVVIIGARTLEEAGQGVGHLIGHVQLAVTQRLDSSPQFLEQS